MNQHEPSERPGAPDPPAAKISRQIVSLHKEFFGRGPVRAKTYIHQDSVLVLMFQGHTASEQTMLEGGGRRAVAQTRVDISETMRARFIEVVQDMTGRAVVGFMSSSQQDPDLLSHVYVLEPTDLLSVVPDNADAT
jgi:uncharacterized protein YbcI